ncbi:MAG TPA: pre-peptidase C-terminal domain-containing protein [Tepidisphaeraceae bacterium]|jgi:hypothetical protein|nr:pre-peptidase C-terminal domain-containing protein [Tepidisphaeraceae bacterium]
MHFIKRKSQALSKTNRRPSASTRAVATACHRAAIEQLEDRRLFNAAIAAVPGERSADNTIAGANALPLNTVVEGRTFDSTDIAIFKLVATPGQTIKIDLDNGSTSGLNSYMRLFDASGRQLAANDDELATPPFGQTANDSFITYKFPAAGTYYVGISGNRNTTYNPVDGTGTTGSSWGAFFLTAIPLPPVDTNDTLASATGAPLNTTKINQDIAIDGTDVDLFRVTVAAGQTVGFDLDTNGSPLDAYMRLFDSGGNQLDANDDGVAPGEQMHRSPYLAHTFARAGTYYVGISGKGNQGYDPLTGDGDAVGSSGAYTLDVRTLATPAVPTDTNDRIATAIGAPLNTIKFNQSIVEPRDVDMFRFTVTAGQRIGFDVDTNGSPLDGYLRLFDSSGNQLAANDDGAAEFERPHRSPYLAHTFARAGTYYVGISGKGNQNYNPLTGAGDAAGSTGAYTLELNDLAFGGQSSYGGADATVTTVDVAFDAAGNRYVLSDFRGTVDFDPGLGITTLSTTTEPLRALAKYAPDNKLIYVRTVDKSDNGRPMDDLAVTPNGHAYVGWNDIDNFGTTFEINRFGVSHIKPDGSDGIGLSRRGISDGYPLAVNALAVAPDGTLFIGGYFNSPDGNYGLIESLNEDGTEGRLNRSYYGSNGIEALVVAPSGDIYVGTDGSLTNYEDPALAVSKIDGTTGDVVWEQPVGREGNSSNRIGSISGLAYDTANNRLFVSGNHTTDAGNVDFDPTAGVQHLPAGDFVWALTESADGRSVVAGQAVSTVGNEMQIDSAGNVYVADTFSGTVDANPGSGVRNVTSAGGTDAIVTKLTGGLQFNDAFRIGGSGDDTVQGITMFDDDLYVAGSYQGTVDFLPGNGTVNRTANGDQDGYVVRVFA